MTALLKKLLSICQSGWREIQIALPLQGRIQKFLMGGGGGGGGGGEGPNFGSQRTVELFCGKLLLTQTATCFSSCERRSPVAPRRTDHSRVPKNNDIFEYPWNLV